MSAPSVIAMRLDEAKRLLWQAGLSVVEVQRTAPPRGGPGGPERVVRERHAAEGVYLVVAAGVVGPGEECATGAEGEA